VKQIPLLFAVLVFCSVAHAREQLSSVDENLKTAHGVVVAKTDSSVTIRTDFGDVMRFNATPPMGRLVGSVNDATTIVYDPAETQPWIDYVIRPVEGLVKEHVRGPETRRVGLTRDSTGVWRPDYVTKNADRVILTTRDIGECVILPDSEKGFSMKFSSEVKFKRVRMIWAGILSDDRYYGFVLEE